MPTVRESEWDEESEWQETGEPRQSDDDIDSDVDWRAALAEEDPVPAPPEELEGAEFIATFDPKWQNAFEGLVYLGRLEATVEIPYHSFVVRTLTTGEKIKVTELIRHLEESIGYARAYRSAVVAAGLVLVDGQPLLVGSRKIDAVSQKYQYIIDNWHDFVVDILFEKINALEGQVIEVLTRLGVYEDRRRVVQPESAEVAGTD